MDKYPFTKCGGEHKVPSKVKEAAKLGLKMHNEGKGFAGGTQTGWDRAKQLAKCDTISTDAARVMKNWFARHGPRAKNGGTSYPGYQKWVQDEKPTELDGKNKNKYRGAVAWLIWGGDPALEWIESLEKKGIFDKKQKTMTRGGDSSEYVEIDVCTIL